MAVTLRTTASVRPRQERGGLRPVELLLLIYLAVATAVAVHRAAVAPSCWWVVVGNTMMALLIATLARPGTGRFGRAAREVYPLVLLLGLYGQLDVLNRAGVPVYDAVVQQWELAVFGTQVSREWWQSSPSVFWSTLLHAAYFSYYFVVTIPAFYFLWCGDLAATRRFVLAVIATFVTCYLAFLFFPVAGPYYAFPRPAPWFTDNVAARLVYDTLAHGSSYGAAFPSSHVAATVAAALAAARGSRRLGLVLAAPTVLLTVGVVYCQMHYGVDALAGLGVGVIVVSATARMRAA